MKTSKFVLLAVAFGFAGAMASAEWGNGLGGEYKTNLIPLNQQSGWGEKMEGEVAQPKKQVKAVPDKTWILSGVQFETGSDTLKSESKSSLDEAADILKEHKRVVVEIQGHTDNIGNPSENQDLSNRRALAVQKYLVDQGVSVARLQTHGYGATAPIADNNTEDGRAQNRRIEFKVLQR